MKINLPEKLRNLLGKITLKQGLFAGFCLMIVLINAYAILKEQPFVRTTTHVHPLAVAGQENSEWIAMDYGTVFVHIMQRGPRAFYDIENLWSDGKITEIADL